MRDRNWRRGQRELAIARATRYMRNQWGFDWWLSHPEDFQIMARKNARTPHPCSRSCCGNPRRHWSGFEKLTMQEHRANLSLLEQIRDAYNCSEDSGYETYSAEGGVMKDDLRDASRSA